MEKNDDVSIESSVMETRLKTKQIVCTWIIKNMLYCYKEVGQYICSAWFTTEILGRKFSWYLCLYPGGVVNYQDWIAVTVNSDVSNEELAAYVTLSIIDKSNCELVQFERLHKFPRRPSVSSSSFLHVNTFLKKSALNSMLSNGNLTIRCKIYVNLDEVNVLVRSTPPEKYVPNETATLHHLAAEFEDFGKLLTNPKFSDVKLVVGDTEFPAHKNVLAARSPVFSAMFEHDMKENRENVVSITDFDDRIMREVLLFIYTGKVSDIESMAKELLPVADKYALNGLKVMCEEALIGTMSEDTIGEIFVLVDQHDADELCTAAIDFVTVHASELATKESFLSVTNNLSPPLLAKVVKAFMLKA